MGLFADSSQAGRTASHALRLWRVPGDDKLIEVQMVASRFAPSGWSFPVYAYLDDMYIEDAPMDALRGLNSITQSENAFERNRKWG